MASGNHICIADICCELELDDVMEYDALDLED